MKTSRHFNISGRIITEKDIARIIGIINEEYHSLESKSKHISKMFKGCTEDGIVFESDNSTEFLSAELIQTKRTISFDSSLIDYNNDLSIYISISHGDSGYRNSISISGVDSNWVNSIFIRLQESIEASSPQDPFIFKYKTIIKIGSAFGIGRLYFFLIDNVLSFMIKKPSTNPPIWVVGMQNFFSTHPFLHFALYYLFCFSIGWFPVLLLMMKAKELWPSVEFQIGPNYTLVEKQRRNILYLIFTLGILPLLISIIYDICKSLFN
jgi:hypothetical protein